ncbi:MAG: hypothetical protein L0H24_12415 [Microlunatus sp.]|nr:hypothetical protein [Microlunatus sp.]
MLNENATTSARWSRQPWLHLLQTAVRGNATCLSDSSGDITGLARPGSASGLYVDDRRVLHHLALTVDGTSPEFVAADSEGPESVCLLAARNAGDFGPDPTVQLRRTLTLVEGGLDVSVDIASRSMASVRFLVRLELAGDGAELHDVKSGVANTASLPVTMESHGRGCWVDARHATVVETLGARCRVQGNLFVAEWEVSLPPGDSRPLEVRVRVTRTAPTGFDAECGAGGVSWDSVRVAAQDARLDRTVRRSLTDLRHLLLTDPDNAADVFAAAGSPWYLTLFGRDSIWAARMCLPFGTELAGGTLRTLARRQGRVQDPTRSEEPGKIPHEVRRTTFDEPGRLHLPPLYYGTVDATPLWVILLHDAWRWGLPKQEIEDLERPLRAALAWMRRSVTDSDDGLLRYADESGVGLSN